MPRIVVATALSLAVGCKDGAQSPPQVAHLIVIPANDTLLVGATRQLTVEFLDANGNRLSGRKATYASSTPSLASVSSTGLVTAIQPTGSSPVTITVASESSTATVAITVLQNISVSVSPATVTVTVGQTQQLTAFVDGSQNTAVTWQSSAPLIATVNSSGTVTGVAPGTAIVTARSVADPARSASATVTVFLWSLVWSDEFDGADNTGIDAANWLYDTGTSYVGGPTRWGTGEIEVMTNSTANVAHDGQGRLRITPLRDVNGTWTSGRIETMRTDFQPPPNGVLAVEASIQQPGVTPLTGMGYWPAFWMLGGPYRGNYNNWPAVGEIDILEAVNGRGTLFSTFHCGPRIPGTCNEPTGLGSGERSCAGCLTGFHTYRMEWDSTVPQQLRWYLDGTNFFTLSQTQVDAGSWAVATSHGYMLILNVSIGGAFPNALAGGSTPTASTVPGASMLIDYVRVYRR